MEVAPIGTIKSLLDISRPIKIVDIGASPFDSLPPPYKNLIKEGSVEIIGFEPDATALAVLNQRKGPLETYLPYAVGDGKRHVLRHCAVGGMTSLLEPHMELLSLYHSFSRWSKVVRREEIDTVRLDDIPEAAGLDFLKIDIQGAELMVFQNATQRLAEALVVHTEVEFVPLYEGQPLFGDVAQFLRGQGFMFHRFEDVQSRAIEPLAMEGHPYKGFGQLLWADAVFIRDIVRLDPLSDEQLLKLAIIMHDCYYAYDIVLRLLTEHNRRTGSGYGKAYLRAVAGMKEEAA